MVAAMNHRASKFTKVLATYTSTVGECAACNQSEDKDAQHEEQEMVHVALSSRWQTTQSGAIELEGVTCKGGWHAGREHCFET